MVQMSFFEKLKVLVDVSSSSGLSIASIFILLFMAFLFLTTNKKNAKSSKKLYLVIYTILVAIIFIQYRSSLANMFDYMMNNFFIVFYFPNLAIYLAAIIATNIILWNTIFNFREDKILKYMNTTIYCMIHYLLILILGIVNKSKLDVFDQSSIYGNNDVAALIGLTSTIFVVWIIFIVVYKIIRKTQKKKQKVRIPVRRVVRYKKVLPSNFKPVSIPSVVTALKPNSKSINPSIPKLTSFYNETNNNLLKEYENIFTLDDYKNMFNLLYDKEVNLENSNLINEKVLDKEVKQEEKQVTNPYIINTRVIEQTNIDEDINDEVEQPKLEELLNLYRSV